MRMFPNYSHPNAPTGKEETASVFQSVSKEPSAHRALPEPEIYRMEVSGKSDR